ncbi:MAG: hypothetical protein OEL66_07290, partial [Desulfobulbaceae bacterium]|nr:hypothetical protein [Desulfobulbaceae bacterium]
LGVLLPLVQKIQAGRAARIALAPKYYQTGLVGEITGLLPDRVKLVRLSIAPAIGDSRQAAVKNNKRVVLEGVVLGDPQSREFVMTGFLQQLAGSALVRDASFIQKKDATAGGETVLHFTAAITPEPMQMPAVAKSPARKTP